MLERTSACPECGAAFVTTHPRKRFCSRPCTTKASNRAQHLRGHPQRGPAKCPGCGNTFIQPRSDSTHCSAGCKRRHQYVPKSTNRCLTCQYCRRTFAPKRSDAKVCSALCAARLRKSIPLQRSCRECGVDISATNGRRKRCPACPAPKPKSERVAEVKTRSIWHRLCAHCAEPFSTGTVSRKYCAPRCAMKAASDRHRRPRTRFPHPAQCRWCGGEHTNRSRRFCEARNGRTCNRCGAPVADGKRLDARFCSSECQNRSNADRRRIRRRGLPMERISRADIFARDQMGCHLCGRRIDSNPTLDHIIPISHPACPGHVWENVAAAHNRCNIAKRDRVRPEDFALYERLRLLRAALADTT
jgi:predicted nucleic acid-binding Zn ribbon protein